MYGTYLRRELVGRKRQTIIVAAGLAIAIALVIVVNALAGGVKDAQSAALASVYGVGTDLTVSGAQAQPGQGEGGRRSFEFGQNGGTTGSDGSTTLSQSRLVADARRGTLPSSTLSTVTGVSGVSAAAAALSLNNVTFDGQLPQAPGSGTSAGGEGRADRQPGEGGGGFGGGSFDVDSFTVLGIQPADDTVGPLSATTLSSGRLLADGDAGSHVAVLDATYASSKGLAVGGTVEVGGTAMQIVGIVASASSSADTAANVYIPLDVAQSLAGVGDVISTIYVQAASAADISGVQSALAAAVPDATVSSQSQLATTVSGSLASASSLIENLGTWLSIIVLVVAVALAVLLTISGVSRRTREFGTLKAIGWSNRRVVGQVAGESVVQGLIGGVAGVVIGLAGVIAVNVIRPTVAAGGAGGPGGGFRRETVRAASEIVLSAPLSVGIVVAAVALAIAGGLVAGAFGGWRAARLSPAEALRSVA
ncbi:ABC transporter permease [Microbacterium sp. SORGH_AS_0888]|uniref:ABC transporter permease n=1 Tax=Microbacterium sp. SORGH_AS_0888 TaxID=3041791 RepID=UPI00277D1EA7|nr:ABC transporter permease [Microbacterium sp. SORGH_AS_0888]MDQ1128062.1 putative ABC transport system permease protein [Microbacterium sp. SORGH_AS_0888]